MSMPGPITILGDAIKQAHADMPGKPAIAVPVEALHFYKDGDTMKCVIDCEQILFLADEIIRNANQKASKPLAATLHPALRNRGK